MLDQGIFCFLKLGRIKGVHRIAVQLERNHKGVSYRVLHQDISGIFLVPEDRPAVHRFLYHGLVIQNTHSAKAVGDSIFVFGIKFSGLLVVLFANIIPGVWHVVKVKLA